MQDGNLKNKPSDSKGNSFDKEGRETVKEFLDMNTFNSDWILKGADVSMNSFAEKAGKYMAPKGDRDKNMLFIPEGFAHGFVVLSDYAEFAYKCTDFYHPDDEGGLLWNDPEIGIEWPIPSDMELTLSEKDTKWPGIASFGK